MPARSSLLLAWSLAACVRKDPPPAAPAAPLPADPEVQLESMQLECDAMFGALATFKETKLHLRTEIEDKLWNRFGAAMARACVDATKPRKRGRGPQVIEAGTPLAAGRDGTYH